MSLALFPSSLDESRREVTHQMGAQEEFSVSRNDQVNFLYNPLFDYFSLFDY